MAEDARSFIDRISSNRGLNTIASIAEVLRHIAVCADELKREVAGLRRESAEDAKQLHKQINELESTVELYVARFSDHIKLSDDKFGRVDGDINRLWGKVDGRTAPSSANGANGGPVLRLSLQGLIALAIVVGGLASFANPQFAAFLQWLITAGKASQ